MRISGWCSDVCSSDLAAGSRAGGGVGEGSGCGSAVPWRRIHQVTVTLRATPKPFNDPENLVDSAVRSMLDHPIHAINQRETMVSQATAVLKHEHDAILLAIKILDHT